MKAWNVEVFIEGRLIYTGTVETGQPQTAAARAIKTARSLKRYKGRAKHYAVRIHRV